MHYSHLLDKQACRTGPYSRKNDLCKYMTLKKKKRIYTDVHGRKQAGITEGKAGGSRFVRGLSLELIQKTDLGIIRQQKEDKRWT